MEDIIAQSGAEVKERFMNSFGAWNVLKLFLGYADTMRLQGLNRYAYDVQISRILSKCHMWKKAALLSSVAEVDSMDRWGRIFLQARYFFNEDASRFADDWNEISI